MAPRLTGGESGRAVTGTGEMVVIDDLFNGEIVRLSDGAES
jgi:hypothetical protein